MNPKTIVTIAAFAALTIVLNLSPFKIPAPYVPFLIYQIWEIPIAAAFLLYGPLVGLMTSVINTIALLVVFPGALPTGPLYNLAAVLSMLLGVYIMHKFVAGHLKGRREAVLVACSTALAIVSRVGIMTVVNFTFLPFPPPVGFDMPADVVLGLIPLIALFNASITLYTVPVGYSLARAVSSALKIERWAH